MSPDVPVFSDVDTLVEIPGESKTDMYNSDAGEFEEFDLI